MPRTSIILIGLAILATTVAAAGADDSQITAEQRASLARYFGFGPMQIYKIKPGIGQLELADLDGDGRTDVALWNAHQSRIELFYQPTHGDEAQPAEELERNEIPSHGNMRRENVPVAYRIAAFKITELTGDKHPDIVFFGEPRELVILPGHADGEFGPADSRRAAEGDPRGGSLCVGDFNHDGRADVALLGADVLQVYHQKPDGGLAKPQRLVHGIKQPGLLLPADLDGNGRTDLIIGSDDDEFGVCVYLQDERGTLSALRRIKVPKTRSMTVINKPDGDDLLAIQAVTGRLNHYHWQALDDTGSTPDWPQRLYSYPLKAKSKRLPMVTGDLTGDGLPDCVAADPDAAQLMLFIGTPDGFGTGQAYPGLVRTIDLQAADIDGDGRCELLSVSAEEKTLGISHFDSGRLTFPKPLAISGQPLVAAVGRLQTASDKTYLAYVKRDKPAATGEEDADEEKDEKETEARIHLIELATNTEKQSWLVEELDDDPSGLRFTDVDQDGRGDLLLFMPYSALRTFLQQADGSFVELKGDDTRSGLVRHASPSGLALIDVTGDDQPELLLAQKGLARALMVREGRWTVIDQYNPETADAEITGLAAIPDKAGSPILAMYDRKSRDLLVLRRRADQAYAVAHSIPVGNYDLTAMQALSLGTSGRHALLMADADKLALLTPGEIAPTLVEQCSYETDTKGAWLGDSVAGDVNHDGVRDVVAVDVRKANLEVLTTLPDGDLTRALRFQVFQGKRFSDDPDAYGEPREVLIADLTNDGIDDIAVLVHDRLIIYPGQ
ncbi:MAG: VCBS repeat-containing protein [Planctomycetota bacterium]